MNKSLLFLFILFVSLGCNKDEEKQVLDATFFELNTACFSSIKLQNAEVVITNAEDYQTFQDTIKRYFFPYCDTTNLPEINFDEAFFTGVYTQTSGCGATYEQKMFYLPESDAYEFNIGVIADGTCEMVISTFNAAIVPLKSETVTMRYQVSYSN
jgi:hypothetical protein